MDLSNEGVDAVEALLVTKARHDVEREALLVEFDGDVEQVGLDAHALALKRRPQADVGHRGHDPAVGEGGAGGVDADARQQLAP